MCVFQVGMVANLWWVCLLVPISRYCYAIPSIEVELLHQLYQQTNGNQWNWKARAGPQWNFNISDPNPCNTRGQTWQGIRCSLPPENCTNPTSLCHVIQIDLDRYQLQGPLLTDWTGFTMLLGLSVMYNNLIGPIPWKYPSSIIAIWLRDNQLTGTIPKELTSLSSLSILHLELNLLTGSIPSEIGLMTSLRSLYLSQNSLTGTLPSSIGQLTSMLVFYVFSNSLVGSIPSTIGFISSLSFLVMDVNSLTGPIPSSIGLLTSLVFLDLDLNYLTGEIPSSLVQLHKLQTFSVDGNQLSSTLPCNLHLLSSITYFDLDYNYFTGFCPETPFPPSLEFLDLSHNWFLSSLPSSLFSLLSQLRLIDFDDNFFYGPLPSNFFVMSRLYLLGGGDNSLTGGLPQSLGQLISLEQLYLENNHLSGSLEPLLTIAALDASKKLYNLDLSNNLLTGQIPADLFLLSKLKTLALTSNCFHGKLPTAICLAHRLQILSFDGLGAAKNCPRTFLQALNYQNRMEGAIPQCIWSLRNLTHLSLAGNAFSGTIDVLPTHSSILNLTLSHNHLSGSIPSSFYRHNFHTLDLSYNKFSGEYRLPDNLTHPKDRRVILEVNRLSGKFPAQDLPDEAFSLIKILNGNVFACHQLPEDDIDRATYRCGSQIFDFSIIVFAPLFGFIVLLPTLAYFSASYQQESLKSITSFHEKLRKYLTPSSHLSDFMCHFSCLDILRSLTIFIYLEETVRYIFAACVLATLPLYLLRFADGSTSTHTHLYRWVWTTAYFTGPVPSTMLLFAWIIVVSVLFFRIRRLKSESSHHLSPSFPHTSTRNLSPWIVQWTETFGPYFPAMYNLLETVFIVGIDIGVMGTVNALYVIASNDKDISSGELFLIQVSFACFKVVWNKLCLPMLDISKESHRVKIFVTVVNSVFIPSIVIALTSSTCFQAVIHPPTEVQSSYTSGICSAVFLANETVYCAGNTPTRVQVTPFTPPLSYNYLCGSTLLATYLPVYCYLYAIQIIAVPINTYFLATHVPYPRLPLRARKLFQGIIWPHHWYSSQRTESRLLNDPTDIEKERPTPRSLLARDTIVSKFTEDILNLITFGLCCPLLALAISISMVVNLLIQRTLIGRFLLAREDAFASPSHSPPRTQSTAPDVALLALNQSLFDLDSSYYRLIWVVIWSSCFFIAFICWDIAGDKMGALESIWIPSLAVVFVLSLQLFERFSSLVTASWIFRCVRSSMVSRAIDLENFSRSTRTHTAADSIPESGMSLSIIHTNTTSQAVP